LNNLSRKKNTTIDNKQTTGRNKEPYMAALVRNMNNNTTRLIEIILIRKMSRYFMS